MQPLLDNLDLERLAEAASRQLIGSAVAGVYTWTLVAARIGGLLAIGPLFGQSALPARFRLILVFALALLVTPALGTHRLPSIELVPASLIDYAFVAAQEFALGFLLGLGVLTLLSGLQLAGQLIDQQTGMALGEVFNPTFNSTATLTGFTLSLLGITLFLSLEPVGGHLLMLSALLETFQTIPVGEAFVSPSAVELLRDLVHQSLVLALQVAAPLLATMALLSLTLGILGRSVPQVNFLSTGLAIRLATSLLILGLAISGIGRTIVDTIPQAIDDLRNTLAAQLDEGIGNRE